MCSTYNQQNRGTDELAATPVAFDIHPASHQLTKN